eukprot:SAG31_NODE_2509_length_5588_cov_2.936170_3_plen_102_part_00
MSLSVAETDILTLQAAPTQEMAECSGGGKSTLEQHIQLENFKSSIGLTAAKIGWSSHESPSATHRIFMQAKIATSLDSPSAPLSRALKDIFKQANVAVAMV